MIVFRARALARRLAIVALVGGAVLAAPAAARAQYAIDLPLGSTLPDLKVETLDGKPANLAPFIGKSPLLIEVWATWCENCKQLEPKIIAAKKKYGTQVKFLGLAVSFNQSPQRVKLHMEKYGFDVETFYDRKGEADAVYGVKATSTVIVVNKAGKIVYAGAGGDQDIEAAIKKAL
ncbi:MAG: TlpA family protein disulfide reductase [Gemmatimonadetes bacterium]|jgi:thiol-disulfide isomerase/thioredoxin|nr:TlpA family protein disulfide reductase [Gemmatimonadota bacterium]MBK6458793.1 TlpA family protein disulfide reductase [Gemmatimonadota bacterium]MBK8057316.1 TlpA family protein disulfide reductase [Gemmatimonadota bacterium]MBK8649031.1 TlpA family protein disulfide reductase [Gemmatimonadota bacterium]HPV77476.1 TlpA disulfide reductase family protein [Gemmatimonadaceae bacterium]